ncbi:acryloyl-CoA reductase [Paenibacillus sp. P96]|uniref:Acryloyl-CoA reductase n=1 Tax=Paenibacillus zeirhizosphaerae TaxID=2987519 RepID=A0ABT9FNC3_9BACL|nr:acryloyl-CoA reductase [Paenibacillus sp. P96]MDP4096231.1 acryloyl-CoA reductase [Paenibacillus sp. P96]
MSLTFRALVIDLTDTFTMNISPLTLKDLPAGEVLIRTAYSSVNFKDGLAGTPDGKIVTSYPFVPGIDCSGTVVASTNDSYREGQVVLVTGYGLGVTHFGGFSEYVRVPAEWVVPLPDGLSLREAMIFGTAGFTAALSIDRLEQNGMAPGKGKVLVTGATGGVGGAAVAMLSQAGYEVTASTGKADTHDYLRSLGASEILSRDEVYDGGRIKALDKQLWQAAVDPVGGAALAAILSHIAHGGSVAVSGLTGGSAVPTTVHPFILRGINLLGIDSVFCPYDTRLRVWERLANDLKPQRPELLVEKEVTLNELPDTLTDILQGQSRGRTIVHFS